MFRYERKFVEEERSYEEVKNWILTHPQLFSPLYFPREINNLYFDTPGFDFYQDNVEGEMNRKKIRIRWYGDREGPHPTVALEYKIKRGLLGTKKTYYLHDYVGAAVWTPRKLFAWLQEQYLPFPILHELKNLRPVLLNHYTREYFSNEDQSIRITLDKNVRYQAFPSFPTLYSSPRRGGKGIIMEIKYSPQLEEQVQSSVQHFPFRLSKSSKYVSGMQTIFEI
jgi:hypothetical protein